MHYCYFQIIGVSWQTSSDAWLPYMSLKQEILYCLQINHFICEKHDINLIELTIFSKLQQPCVCRPEAEVQWMKPGKWTGTNKITSITFNSLHQFAYYMFRITWLYNIDLNLVTVWLVWYSVTPSTPCNLPDMPHHTTGASWVRPSLS